MLQEALETHNSVVGGRDALQSLVVIERQGRFLLETDGQTFSGSYHTCVHYPERVAVAIDAGPVQVHQVLGDNGALECRINFTACSPANSMVATDLIETATIANREQLYMEFPETIEYAVSNLDDSIRFTYTLDGIRRGIGFDKNTGLIGWLRYGTRERFLSDWRLAGDVMLPFSIKDIEGGGEKVETTLASAKSFKSPTEWCMHAFTQRGD